MFVTELKVYTVLLVCVEHAHRPPEQVPPAHSTIFHDLDEGPVEIKPVLVLFSVIGMTPVLMLLQSGVLI